MRWIVLVLFLANVGVFAWLQTSGHAPVTPDAAVTTAPPAEAGDTIRLLSELDRDELESRDSAAPAPRAPASSGALTTEGRAGTAGAVCTLVGPFEEGYQGEDVVQRLRALQLDAELREVEVPGQMRYWVYLEPLSSRREAFNRLRELQAAGVDSYVIPKGSLTHGISFGIFSERDRAQLLSDELRAQGIDAQMREEPQMIAEQWVVLAPGAADALAGDFWAQLQLDYPELDRRQNLCAELETD
ncbi:hypothetical protein [Microbulbifer sp. M83]|uniref:hypothetical protein n=1 Tax=Microbulbifer sp. M83 TaxID=3118246 RepID=UPI002FDF9133